VALGSAIAGSARVILSADTRQLHSGLRSGEHAFTRSTTAMRRSVGMLSASLIGGAGLGYAARESFKEFQNAEVVLARVRKATENAGVSWGTYGEQIDKVIQKQSYLTAFEDEEMLDTFGRLVTRTRDVNKALELNALAADIARGRNMSLEASAQLVIKASIGQIGQLRRLGIDIDKNASATEALAALQSRYAGSAAKFADTSAGSQARLNKTLGDTQEIIGGALAPAVDSLARSLGIWMADTENQAKLQETVNQAVTTASSIVNGLAGAFRGVRAVLSPLNTALGGTEETVKLIAITFAGMTFARVIGGLSGIGAAAGPAGAAGKVGKLQTRLLGLNALTLAPIVIPITYAVTTKILDATGGTDLLKRHGGRVQDTLAKFGLGQEEQAAMSPKELRERVAAILSGNRQRAANAGYRIPGSRADQLPSQRLSDVTLQPVAKDAKPPKPIKFSLDRFRLAEARARTEQQELDVLKDEQAFIRSRIRARRYRGEQLLLAEEALKQVEAQIDGIIEGRKDAKEKAAEARHRAAEDRADKRAAAAKKRADIARRKEEARIKEDIRYRTAVGDRLRAFNKRARQKAAHEEVAVALGPLQQQAFLNELTGVLGQFASNVAGTAGGPPTGVGRGAPLQQHFHFHKEKTMFAGMREAKLAAVHVL